MKRKGVIFTSKLSRDLIIILISIISILLFMLFYSIIYGSITILGYNISLPLLASLISSTSVLLVGSFIIMIWLRGIERRGSEKEEERIVRLEGLPFIEIYPIDEPYVYAGICKIENKLEYHVIEPYLSEEEKKLKEHIDEKLYYELSIDSRLLNSNEDKVKILKEGVEKIIRRYKWRVESRSLEKIMYYIIRDHIGYGKIDALMKDENIEDISCNGPGQPVYVYHRFYESIPTNISFEEEELDNFVMRLAYIAGRHVSISTPIVDATLPDGTRINITFRREISRRGSTFTIRKFRKEPFTIVELIKMKTLDVTVAAHLWFLIENMASILVAGGTATGKTTLLNALSLFIRPDKKIVSIEDTAELQLYHENWNPLIERTGFGVRKKEAEIRMFDLLKTALRQRPDIIIVGEVRGEEAYTMFQAMATGHGGLGSIHAESPEAVINRLTSEPMNVPEPLILTLDSIVLIARVKRGDRIIRKVLSVTEPYWDEEEDRISIRTIYEWDAFEDKYKLINESKALEKIGRRYGISMDVIREDIDKRKTILEWMVKRDISNYKEFIDIMRRYYLNPEEVYNVAKFELISLEKK